MISKLTDKAAKQFGKYMIEVDEDSVEPGEPDGDVVTFNVTMNLVNVKKGVTVSKLEKIRSAVPKLLGGFFPVKDDLIMVLVNDINVVSSYSIPSLKKISSVDLTGRGYPIDIVFPTTVDIYVNLSSDEADEVYHASTPPKQMDLAFAVEGARANMLTIVDDKPTFYDRVLVNLSNEQGNDNEIISLIINDEGVIEETKSFKGETLKPSSGGKMIHPDGPFISPDGKLKMKVAVYQEVEI